LIIGPGRVLDFFHAIRDLWEQTARSPAAYETGRIAEKIKRGRRADFQNSD